MHTAAPLISFLSPSRNGVRGITRIAATTPKINDEFFIGELPARLLNEGACDSGR